MADLTRDYGTSKMDYQSLLDKKIAADIATNMERSRRSEHAPITNRRGFQASL